MCALAVASDYANHYRVTSVVEVQKLLELIAQHDELNVLHTHPINRTTVAVELLQTKQEIDRIGLNVKVVGKRGEVQDAIEAERRLPRAPLNFSKNNFFDSYRTWEEIEAQTGYLLLNNPSLLTNSQLGTTVEGRPIPIIRMSASRDPRPGFYIQCLVHAREWLAGPFCVYVLETMTAAYAAGDPGVRRILNNMAIWVVPVLNIDGYDYTWNGNRLWRKNRSFNSGGSRGVDLNRNYDIQWGTTGVSHSPSSDNYCGPSACSEPECKAVTEFMKNHPEVIGAWDMHICGPYILYPWDYTASHGVPQPDRATYEGLAHELNKAVSQYRGSNYRDIQGGTWYATSGASADYWYQQAVDVGRKRWSFTFEARCSSSFTSPPSDIMPVVTEQYAGLMAMLEFLLAQV